MLHWIKRLAAVSALSLLAACGSSNDDPPPPGTLAQVATSSGFNALVAAADKAGLVPALNDAAGNLTVFAPTDAAFTTLAGTLGFASAADMVAALDAATLAKILQYHVLPRRRSPPTWSRVAPRRPRCTASRARRRRWPWTPRPGSGSPTRP